MRARGGGNRRKTPLVRQCAHCGEAFEVVYYTARKYCSYTCANRATAARRAEAIKGPRPHRKKPRQRVMCRNCGTFVELTESAVAKGRGVYCSKECFRALLRSDSKEGAKARALDVRRTFSLVLKGERKCRNCDKPAAHLHHMIPRSMSRAAIADIRNGLPLCAGCHHGWHYRTCTIFRDVIRPDELAYLLSVPDTGRNIAAWLDERYPTRYAGNDPRHDRLLEAAQAKETDHVCN